MSSKESALNIDFRKWFKEQFGKIPNTDERIVLRHKVVQLKLELHNLESKLRDEELLNAKFDAALKCHCRFQK